jgi:hypothetical protein
VQVLTQQAPALHAPLAQVEVADSYTQFCASAEHVASVVVFAHVIPAAAHTGSVLHVQAPLPVAALQLWCAPQATGAP